MTRRPFAAAATALAAALVVAGCSAGGGSGSGGSESPTGATSTSASATSTSAAHVARVGVITADRGLLGSSGKGVRNSVELALQEANATGAVPGWSFEVAAFDDNGSQSGGQQAASGLAADASVLGVVGTLRTTIDEGVQPIFNAAGIPLVSPAGTGPQLTRRLDGTTTVRPFPTYFRLAPTDTQQGPAAGRFAATTLKVKRVAVVTDGTSYGRLLAGGFGAEVARAGVARPVSRTLVVTPGTDDAVAEARRVRVATAIRRADVDAVFFGGTSGAGAAFAQVLRQEKVRVPFLGGDAFLDGMFVRDLGALSARGAYAVFPGAAPQALTTASGFLRRYRAAGLGQDPGPYGANAYDAARALVRAFGINIGDRTEVTGSVRRGVVAGLESIRMPGATGVVTFDRFGDVVDPPLSVYRFTGVRWRVAGVVRLG